MNASSTNPLVLLLGGLLMAGVACTSDGTPNPGDPGPGDNASGDALGGDPAMGDPPGSDADMGDATGDSIAGDDSPMLPPGCTYPIQWQPAAGAEAAASADLTSLDSGATLVWSDPRGAFTDINGLTAISLDCDSDPNIWTDLVPIINAYPDLFQMDMSEYDLSDTTCSSIINFGTAVAERDGFGSADARRGNVTFFLQRNGGNIEVFSVGGTYLPQVPSNIQTAIDACPGLNLAEIRSAIAATPLDYTVLNGCAPTSNETYSLAVNDMVMLEDQQFFTPGWNWSDGSTGVELTFEATANVTVNPANWTTPLQSSDAICPNPSGPGNIIGWGVELDMLLGTILNQVAGIGCFVC